MIKKLRVTVDGIAYDVTVELPDQTPGLSGAAEPISVPPVIQTTATLPALPSAPPPSSAAAPPQAAAPESATGPGEVPSPLAGRVTAVVVKAGQEVKEGDHLVTLEAMKMNTFVFAPRSGKVAEIKTEVGAAVEEGQSLARIE
jgi:glutaconyl-CoA/methylmalonyl-CoA decarboxylase subunit gamma